MPDPPARQRGLIDTSVMIDLERIDADAARAYGRMYAGALAAGCKARGARALDLLIAATAPACQLRLYTRNPVDFAGLSQLIEIVGT